MGVDFRTTSRTLLDQLGGPQGSEEWQAAWERFVKQYGPPILGLCQRYGVRQPHVEDVLQEVLLKLQASMTRFEHRRWLKVVVERSLADLAAELEGDPPGGEGHRIREALRAPGRPEAANLSNRARQVLAGLTTEEEARIGHRWRGAGTAIWRDSRPHFDDLLAPLLTRSFRKWGLDDDLAARAAARLQARIDRVLDRLEEDSLPRFRSWLAAVVRNAARDCLEQVRQMVRCGDDRFAELVETLVDEKDFLSEFELREVRLEAERRIRSEGGVSDRHWEIYSLMVHDGCTGPEAAERLGATVGSVYMAAHRVRKKVIDEVRRLQGPIPDESDPEEP